MHSSGYTYSHLFGDTKSNNCMLKIKCCCKAKLHRRQVPVPCTGDTVLYNYLTEYGVQYTFASSMLILVPAGGYETCFSLNPQLTRSKTAFVVPQSKRQKQQQQEGGIEFSVSQQEIWQLFFSDNPPLFVFPALPRPIPKTSNPCFIS